jgi:hypothetical protein
MIGSVFFSVASFASDAVAASRFTGDETSSLLVVCWAKAALTSRRAVVKSIGVLATALAEDLRLQIEDRTF